jgi:hypothetical protein
MDDPSEVALEDYARVLTRSRSAEAVRAETRPDAVSGVHLCGPAQPPTEAALADLEDFARSLGTGRTGGLGWS